MLLLRMIVTGVILFITGQAYAAELNCFTSPGQFWALESTFSPGGGISINGHVHNIDLPTMHPCWTQFFIGSGIVYPKGHEKHGTADGVIVIHDVQCPTLVWRLKGTAGDLPPRYAGLLEINGAVSFETLLALENCDGHP